MARMWIVVGDTTTSGGRVLTGSPFTDIDDKAIARIGDQVLCPLHKGTFPIVDGDMATVIDGKPVALHGSSIACGCTLLSLQQNHVFVDEETRASDAQSTFPKATGSVPTGKSEAIGRYDEAFILSSAETGKSLTKRHYRIIRENGDIEAGTTDDVGMTGVIVTTRSEKLVIELAEEGP